MHRGASDAHGALRLLVGLAGLRHEERDEHEEGVGTSRLIRIWKGEDRGPVVTWQLGRDREGRPAASVLSARNEYWMGYGEALADVAARWAER